MLAHDWQTAPSPNHGRAKPGREKFAIGDVRKRLEQHVRDQVHAVPPFFEKIANDADAQLIHARPVLVADACSRISFSSPNAFSRLQCADTCSQPFIA